MRTRRQAPGKFERGSVGLKAQWARVNERFDEITNRDTRQALRICETKTEMSLCDPAYAIE